MSLAVMGEKMAASIFSNQFMPVWTAIFALGNSGMAFLAMETGRRMQAAGAILTTAFLVYLTYAHLGDLPRF